MPPLRDTRTEGVIARWHNKWRESVKKGDLLAAVETDKATMDLESYKDGALLHVGVEKGGKLQVNDLLAIIGNKGEDISDLLKSGGSQEAKPKEEAKKEEPKKEEAKKETTGSSAPKAKGSSMDISKMDEVVLMPRLSDTMTEGVIAGWLKNVGDTVKKGDVLAEIETDKAAVERESYKNGTLLYQGAKKGEKIAVNALLCIIGDKDKVDVGAIVAASKGSGESAPAEEKPATKETTKEETQEQQKEEVSSSSTSNGRIKASPLAKKYAAEKEIEISKLKGSGDGGRIVKADVDSYKPGATTTEEKSASAVQPFAPAGEEGYTDIPNSQIRNVIAKRLGES